MKRALCALALLAAPAWAEEPRFCPNRPDIGSSACTVAPGRALAEVSGIDWTRSDDADTREDTLLFGDLLLRIGVAADTEVQVGWTPFGVQRTRDKATGIVTRVRGPGDVRLAVRQHVLGPNGEGDGVALALEPFVTVPIGRTGIGESDWSGGVVVPVSYALDDDWELGFTGEASAVSAAGGHRLALGGTLGIERALSREVSAVAEVSVQHEDGAAAQLVTGLSLAWQPRDGLQLDVLAVAGLNHAAPDVQLVLGGAVLF